MNSAATADLTYMAPDLRELAVPVSSLIPDPENARRHGPENRRRVRKSLVDHGQLRPIVVRAGRVIAGSCTLEETIGLGRGWIAAVLMPAEEMSDQEARAYGIADNRSGELGDWDDQALVEELRGLKEERRAQTGFSDEEIARLLDGKSEPKTLKIPGRLAEPVRAAIVTARHAAREPDMTDGAALARICDSWMRDRMGEA